MLLDTLFLRGDTGSGKFTLAPDVQSTLTCYKYHNRKACVFAFENVAVYDYLRPSMKHFLSVHWINIRQVCCHHSLYLRSSVFL